MATTKANGNAVYRNVSSSRHGGQTSRASGSQNVCATNMQAALSSSSSGYETKSFSHSVDHSLSHKPESERSKGATDNLDSLVANSIGRLVFEAGLEPGFMHLPSFNGVIDLLTRGVWIAMPSYEYILQVQLSEVQQREKAMRQHWERRGCSLILDSWKSRCGRSFISAFVHCKEEMFFLRSIDISTIFDDVDELAAMVSCLIGDIGVQNIVQVITNNVSSHMQATEHAVLKKYEQSFIFTVCADHCINLLLENIAELDHVKDVLKKAREITRFGFIAELDHVNPDYTVWIYHGENKVVDDDQEVDTKALQIAFVGSVFAPAAPTVAFVGRVGNPLQIAFVGAIFAPAAPTVAFVGAGGEPPLQIADL